MSDPSYWPQTQDIVRVLAAAVLGGLIGVERQARDKPAGFRTILLICVGACLFTILSERAGQPPGDPTRIAAQIVTGIGFLGAGAILRGERGVTGLTTAATVWVVAAVGMAIGFGYWGVAVFGTGISLAALLVFHVIDDWINRNRIVLDYCVTMARSDEALERLAGLLRGEGLRILERSYYEKESNLVCELRAIGPNEGHDRARMLLIRSDDYQLCKCTPLS